ncbi:MAG TPA: HAMP domain-containing methyl-accepting chemotaxis protein [Xanthobacteraceae bacterium]|nr:HAMP domain-containing methyl-accepting chemotaxis protein [Xanthobacteraceae bacterium]
MSWLLNLSIRVKAFLAPVFLLLCLAGLGAEAYRTLGASVAGLAKLTDSDLVEQRLVDDLTTSITNSHLKLFRYASWLSTGVTGEPLKALEKEIADDSAAATKRLQELKARQDLSDDDRAAAANLEKAWEKYRTVGKNAIEVGAVQAGMAVMMFGEADDLYKTISVDLTKITDSATKRTEQVAAGLSQAASGDQRTILAGIILAFVISIPVAVVVAMSVARPVQDVTRIMRELSGGNYDVEVGYQNRRDEIGHMVAAIEVFRKNACEKQALEEAREQAARCEQAAAERKGGMLKLADQFEAALGGIIEMVSSSASQLESAAKTLSTNADTTQQLATVVAGASEEASTNVQSVASAAEQMSGSVHEIGRQVGESRAIAQQGAEQAQRTDIRVAQLSEAAGRIGDVVKLITAIAEQTNLLALNATIEAARAGDAGRGFAVVAQEVKALAGQTAKATGEIGTQIAAMQAATADSVGAMKEIGGTIARMSQIAGAIAAAVEEQDATTQEIARSVQQAAAGTAEVATNIVSVSRGANETGAASSQVLSSARSLANESNRLKAELAKFLVTVRAA